MHLLCPDNTDIGFCERAKVVGIKRAMVVGTLPPTPAQIAEDVAAALLAGLAGERFLISLTPDYLARLEPEASRGLAESPQAA